MPRPITREHALLDGVKDFFELSLDTDLAEILRVKPSCLSKIRSGTNKVSALVLLRIHLLTEVPVKELLSYCGKNGADI